MASPVSSTNQTALKPMVVACALFFIFGFVTWANGTLIPFLKLACGLETDLQAFLVTFASYIAYFFLALPSSWILKQLGFKNGLIVGLLILGIGSLIFIPAAETRSFPIFLTGIFIQGAALSLLQTAVNPYLSIIGPIDSAAKRISIAGICNKSAGVIAPLILGSLFLKNSEAISKQLQKTTDLVARDRIFEELLARVHTPYIIQALIFVILALIIKFTSLPEVNVNQEDETDPSALQEHHTNRKTSIFQFPHLFLGALCIFFCVAVEVMAGDIIGVYGRELQISPSIVKYSTSFTLACMLIGYVLGIITIPKIVSQQKALRICAITGVIFTTASFLTQGNTAYILVALLGLANSLMWPAIFPLGIKGLGRFTKTGSAIMIMGIAGGAIWPLVFGYLKDHAHIHFQLAFWISMVPAYLYILFFAVKGHTIGKKENT